MIHRVLARLDRYFNNRSRNSIVVISLVLALAIGALDLAFKAEFLIFYLAPVFLAAWYGGWRAGLVISIYCAGAWFVAGALQAGPLEANQAAIWTLLARLTMFLAMTNIVSRLRATMRQQAELTGFIVHDLRSPISSSISGLMTLEQTSDNLDDLEKEMISLALVSNKRALSLVNAILDVSKLEDGKMQIRPESTDIDKLVEECFAQVALWAKTGDISFVKEIKVATAIIDPDLTSRIIVNLLSNALKYSPPNCSIRVVVVPASREMIRFTIEDKGAGIPPEYVDSVFDPFTQVKGTKGGTGLGLTFCRLAVQAQGGRIWVESALGQGTKMHFTLPRQVRQGLAEVSSRPELASEQTGTN